MERDTTVEIFWVGYGKLSEESEPGFYWTFPGEDYIGPFYNEAMARNDYAKHPDSSLAEFAEARRLGTR